MAALGEGDVIERLARRDVRGNGCGFSGINAAGHAVVAGQFHAEDEIGAAGRAYASDHLSDEPRAARQIAAEFVLACIRPWRQKLMKQMSVPGGNFHAAKAAAFKPGSRLCKLVVHAANFGDGHWAWHRAA